MNAHVLDLNGAAVDRRPNDGPEAMLLLQMLDWLAARPRTYRETMDAWRTSCPRLSVWEDAVDGRLVRLDRAEGARTVDVTVHVTQAGLAMLAASPIVGVTPVRADPAAVIATDSGSAPWTAAWRWLIGSVRTVWAAADLARDLEVGRRPSPSHLAQLGLDAGIARRLAEIRSERSAQNR